MEHFRWHPSATWFAHLFKAVCKQHHKEDLPLLRRVIPVDGVVLDVGAHAGQFAKLYASVARKGRVYAFEPGGYARSILRPAIFFNRCRNVTILPVGLGDRAGVEALTLPVKRRGSYGFGLAHLGEQTRWPESRIEIVAIATLDDVFPKLGETRLDFVKADIEGWELHMIRGARETLTRYRPVMMLEMVEAHLQRAGDTLAAAYETLAALGYRPHLFANGEFMPVENIVEGDIWWRPI